MPRCRTHYSRKAARRVLDALMRLGGKGTTAQIAEITGGCAVHSDVHSLRTWLREEHGYDRSPEDALAAVRAVPLGLNSSGRNVYQYELRRDVKALHRQIRDQKSEVRSQESADLRPPPSALRSPSSDPRRQGALFETRSAADERRAL